MELGLREKIGGRQLRYFMANGNRNNPLDTSHSLNFLFVSLYYRDSVSRSERGYNIGIHMRHFFFLLYFPDV
jgi:hypothetical protein